MPVITVQNLTKSFRVPEKDPGIVGSLKSLVNRKHIEKKAVENISFEINEGEFVGFIGPNGAGKTTTLKCLSGLLYPSLGKVDVLGFKPFDRKKEFLKKISLVMGQKNQLWWDLPAMESFLLNKEIYEIEEKHFKKTIDTLVELLQVQEVLQIPVRNLSLGQRMKCELIAALLHTPKIIFLDEPTIGLDVVMQQNLRSFIKEYNHKYNATIILTSHYMEDVKELCERVLIIDHGKLMYDGKLQDIIKEYSHEKLLTLVFDKPVTKKELEQFGKIIDYSPTQAILSVSLEKAKHTAAKLLENFPVNDLNIEEPKIEDIIRQVFSRKSDTSKF